MHALAFFLLRRLLDAEAALPEVFCEAGNNFSAVLFVLNAVHTCKSRGAGSACGCGLRKPCAGIQADSGGGITVVRDRDFDAIGESRELQVEMRM